MKEFKNILGTKESTKPIVVNIDTVYVNSNIKEIENEYGNIYEYDQIQYDKNEFIELIGKENSKLKNENELLRKELTEVMEAITSIVTETEGVE